MKKILWILPILIFITNVKGENNMDQQLMEKIVKEMATESKGENGVVEFNYNSVRMYLISDPNHDRMRIIAPIAEYQKLSRRHIDAALESNFHGALDARYAVSDGVLYSAYIHPLSELSNAQVRSAVLQVSNLALSFGEEYSSGVLSYGQQQQSAPQGQKNKTL